MSKEIIITNNIAVKEEYAKTRQVLYFNESLARLFEIIRDYVHKGHILLTHPLSGSVKPNENPFKSALISSMPQAGGRVDEKSLNIIEQSIITARKFENRQGSLMPQMQKDFQTIDLALITSAINK